MNIVEVTDKLVVEITMVNSNTAPYSFFEILGIKDYRIVDANDNIIVENKNLEPTAYKEEILRQLREYEQVSGTTILPKEEQDMY